MASVEFGRAGRLPKMALVFGFYHVRFIPAVRSMAFVLPSALFLVLSSQLLHLAFFSGIS